MDTRFRLQEADPCGPALQSVACRCRSLQTIAKRCSSFRNPQHVLVHKLVAFSPNSTTLGPCIVLT